MAERCSEHAERCTEPLRESVYIDCCRLFCGGGPLPTAQNRDQRKQHIKHNTLRPLSIPSRLTSPKDTPYTFMQLPISLTYTIEKGIYLMIR
jgi:hypothetical protein